MRGYLIYVALIFAGFALWVGLLAAMRRDATGKRVWGHLLLGPLHGYLMRRGYRLTKREVVGWCVVLLLMLVAPLLTFVLEG